MVWRKTPCPEDQRKSGPDKLYDLGRVPSPLQAHSSVTCLPHHIERGSITIRIRHYSFQRSRVRGRGAGTKLQAKLKLRKQILMLCQHEWRLLENGAMPGGSLKGGSARNQLCGVRCAFHLVWEQSLISSSFPPTQPEGKTAPSVSADQSAENL